MAGELTDLQRRFVDAYLGAARFNASEAAKLAGYSEKTRGSIGHENLKKPEIQEAIRERVNEYAMGAEEVLAELTDIARNSKIGSLLRGDKFSKPGLTFFQEGPDGKDVPRDEVRFIKKIAVNEDGVSVEVYNRMEALEKLGKFHGLFTDRLDLTTGGKPIKLYEGIDTDKV